MFHTQGKEIRKRTSGFENRSACVGARHWHGYAICGRAEQLLENRFSVLILYLEVFTMPERQGGDDSGLNFQTRKANGRKIQTNFDIVIFIEPAANRLRLGNVAIRGNEKLPRYCGL